jgi:hypothetical protein
MFVTFCRFRSVVGPSLVFVFGTRGMGEEGLASASKEYASAVLEKLDCLRRIEASGSKYEVKDVLLLDMELQEDRADLISESVSEVNEFLGPELT